MKKETTKFSLLVIFFLGFYYIPLEVEIVRDSIYSGFLILQDYAQKHVLFCLIPAFFIAGSITVFAKKEAVLKLLGAKTNKLISYSVASVSGGVLAVCSCTILPLFAGIWKRGAGIGPATAFLYSGPAINIAAIFLTGTVLGWELSFVRLGFSVIGAIIIGLLMSKLFTNHNDNGEMFIGTEKKSYSTSTIAIFFLLQLSFLVTASLNFNKGIKYLLLISYVVILLFLIFTKFDKEHNKSWIEETWSFSKKILPFLFAGVFIAGVISKALPKEVVNELLGGNKLFSNFFASIFGAFMYFATLTEVPILQGLISNGMGKGPALALLLAGPALSLPNMLVIRSIMGTKKTIVFVVLVVIISTVTGIIYGNLF